MYERCGGEDWRLIADAFMETDDSALLIAPFAGKKVVDGQHGGGGGIQDPGGARAKQFVWTPFKNPGTFHPSEASEEMEIHLSLVNLPLALSPFRFRKGFFS